MSEAGDNMLLKVEGLTRSVRGANGAEQKILDRVSFEVAAGEIFAVVGPSGSGKSSLLRCLNALDEPDEGEVVFEGRSLRDWPLPELRRRAAILTQTPDMFPGSVQDNLMAPLRLRDGRRAEPGDERFKALLASVGLDESFLARQAATLSVGQQQRVAFARALVLQPRLALLDEPTASLDPAAAGAFLEQLSGYSRREGLTVVIVTHQLEHARRVADRVLLLIGGRPVCVQRTVDFFEHPECKEAQRFIRGELEG